MLLGKGSGTLLHSDQQQGRPLERPVKRQVPQSMKKAATPVTPPTAPPEPPSRATIDPVKSYLFEEKQLPIELQEFGDLGALLMAHYEQQLSSQEAKFVREIEELRMEPSQAEPVPSSKEENNLLQKELDRALFQNTSLRVQNEQIESEFKRRILDLEKDLRKAKNALDGASSKAHHRLQQNTELERTLTLTRCELDEYREQAKQLKRSLSAEQAHNPELSQVLSDNETLKQQVNSLISALDGRNSFSSEEPDYAETNVFGLRPKKSPVLDIRIVNNLTDKLVTLEQDKRKLEAELLRLPEHAKRVVQLKRRQEVQMELDIVNTNISSLKGKLRVYGLYN